MEDGSMSKVRLLVVAFAGVVLLAGVAVAADDVKSGPQVGKKVTPLHPLNVTGPKAGEKACLVCSNGSNPVAMVFVRDCNENVTKLIKKIDEATARNKDKSMGSFVVFLSDSPEMREKIKEVAKKEGIKNCILSVDDPSGPKGYEVDRNADVTVVLYDKQTVKANHAFRKGEMKDKDIDRIVGDVSKIVPNN
jgi:hypothetical protein